MIVLVFLLVIGLAAAVWGVFAFNRLVHLRNQVRNAWADIDVQLKRRHDLVPQLVAAVKGYTGHERGVLQSVTELRTQAVATNSPAKLGDVESSLEQAIVQLFALKEAYPNLKANETFLQLQRDLVAVEDQLQYARRFYNGAVRDFNTAIQRVPDMFVAKSFGFSESEYFQADQEDRPAVRVDLAS
jgi:LemA protein